jgi:tetratricopeptide (TPR) repeat protein
MTSRTGKPTDARTLHNLGVEADRDGEHEQAANYYRAAIEADPGQLVSRKALASLLLDHGDHDEARRLYRELLQRLPGDVDIHFNYSRLARYVDGDPALAALEGLTRSTATLSPEHKIKLAFTVGKANDDLGEYDDAFGAYHAGNELHYKRQGFDERGNFAMLDDVERCFDTSFNEGRQIDFDTDVTPVFVLGMPRSGSTLVEQILAGHSDIGTAGEVKYLQQTIQEHLIRDRQTFGKAVATWQPADLEAAARAYLERLRTHRRDGRFVVDKLPGNFAFVGLIAAMLPMAKIVHTARHPMATLWSCYSTLFADGLNYTYDLDVLARYLLRYRRLMAHWDRLLPGGVHTLSYEQLVREPAQTTRALLGFLGVEWQACCLEFHSARREVRTASVAQVRRPLYTTALDHWQNYRDRLRPYEAALDAD